MSRPDPIAAAHGMRVAGSTHVGSVRTHNEDSMVVDPKRGFYAVFDGMGGANAGDVASQLARDVVSDFIATRVGHPDPRALLDAALNAGCAAVHHAGLQVRERHGMGTTAVACLISDPRHAWVAHVGDSRAYLLRRGRLSQLTRDHTIVEELVIRGLLPPEEVERHPHKNVLSRNLGAQPFCRVDVLPIELEPGDRLLLCSDGLYGYAMPDAMQYILGSGDAPEHVAKDLVELALRGGGGDNVSTIVIELPAQASSTQVVRTTGAQAWWAKRQRFVAVCRERGLTRNPICRGLEPTEALELIASSVCQAIYHDLEKSTGVNVWTFAQNVAGGWFAQGGEWDAIRALFDVLGGSATAVVEEIRGGDPQLGFLLDVAVSRALVVAELALGGLLAEQLRAIDAEVIALHGKIASDPVIPLETSELEALEPARATPDPDTEQPSVRTPTPVPRTSGKFIEAQTLPFMRPERAVTNPGVSNELLDAIGHAIVLATARVSPRARLVHAVLSAVETVAADRAGNFASAVLAARELYGVRVVDDAGIMPLFDALDQARVAVAAAVQQLDATDATRAKVLAAVSAAHQRIVGATTGLVLEAIAPISERLREAQAQTAALRDQVAQAERRRADLERRFATNVDPSLPWGQRGNTNW